MHFLSSTPTRDAWSFSVASLLSGLRKRWRRTGLSSLPEAPYLCRIDQTQANRILHRTWPRRGIKERYTPRMRSILWPGRTYSTSLQKPHVDRSTPKTGQVTGTSAYRTARRYTGITDFLSTQTSRGEESAALASERPQNAYISI